MKAITKAISNIGVHTDTNKHRMRIWEGFSVGKLNLLPYIVSLYIFQLLRFIMKIWTHTYKHRFNFRFEIIILEASLF